MRRFSRPALLGVLMSQGASSAGNFGLTVLVARQQSVLAFAAYSGMYAYYTWAQGLWRSSTLDPLLSITWSAERSSLLAGEVVWQLLTRTAPLVALVSS